MQLYFGRFIAVYFIMTKYIHVKEPCLSVCLSVCLSLCINQSRSNENTDFRTHNSESWSLVNSHRHIKMFPQMKKNRNANPSPHWTEREA